MLTIESIAVDDLSHDPANVRQHGDKSIAAIKASLRRFGQQKPIVIDANNVVRAGNGTLEAARELGWDKLDCVRSGLGGADMVAYAIADNRTAELADWNNERLVQVLNGLNSDDDKVMEDLSFSPAMLAAFADAELAKELGGDLSEEGDPDEDEDPYARDEERGIERVPAPLFLQIVLTNADMEMVKEATLKYQQTHEEATRDHAIIGILKEYLNQ